MPIRVHSWLQDLRFGWRMMLAKPGFTAAALLSIALGIGATTTIFSVVYAVLLHPYPYRDADRIGSIAAVTGADKRFQPLFSPAQYAEISSRMHSMEDEVAVQLRQPVLIASGVPPQAVLIDKGSPNFFDFFSVPALLGREFSARDFPAGREPDAVAVIGYQLWQRAFLASPNVLGKKIKLDHTEYTIIGVLPPRFQWNRAGVYVPLAIRPGSQDFVQIFSRMRPNVSAKQVQAEFEPLIRQFQKQVPHWYYPSERFRVKWVGLNDGILGKFATTLLVLFAAVVLLLLIGCGNVANLLLARATAREGEMAIRASMGATRARLIRQTLTESILLAVTGGAFGILLAIAGVNAVIALLPEYSIPSETVIALNWPVLWFAVAVAVLTGILFGLVPAFRISAGTQAEALKGTGRGGGAGVRHRRLLDTLVAFEIALSLLLLTGAGLALKGLLALEQKPLGYDPDHALTAEVVLRQSDYTHYAARRNFFEAIASGVNALPGVTAAGISEDGTPPWNGLPTRMMPDTRPVTEPVLAHFNIVDAGYFAVVRQPVLAGRLLTHDDIVRVRPVAVISQDFAARYFKNMNPIGHHIRVDLLDQPLPAVILKAPNWTDTFEIVGVVGAAKNRGLNDPPAPAIFAPYTLFCSPGIFLLARTPGDPMSLANEVRQVVSKLDPQQAVTEIHPLAYWSHLETAYPHFATFLFGVFGAAGLLLAGAGVFSVVSYSVAQRTHEFGIRMALGADRRDVLKLVLTATARVFAAGVVCGLLLSIFAAHELTARMQGMGNADFRLFLAVSVVLMLATLAACIFPARAATSMQAMDALRHE